MARLFTCGAEWNSVTEVGLVVNGTAPTVTTTAGNFRSGARGFSYSAASAGTSFHSVTLTGTAINRSYGLRCYIKRSSFASGMKIMANLISAAVCSSVRLSATAAIQLWDDVGAVQIGSDGPILSNTGFTRVDLLCQIGDALADPLYLFVDGQLIAQRLTSFTNNAVTTWQWGCITSPGAASALFIDDIAISDSVAGGDVVSAPVTVANPPIATTEGKIVLQYPTSDLNRTGYVTGAAGITSLFDALDNFPPIGAAAGTATNRIHSPTNNATDQYTAVMRSLTLLGVPSNVEITIYHLHANFGGASATADGQALSYATNPVIAEGAAINKPAAVWGTYPTNWVWGFSSVVGYYPSVSFGGSGQMKVRRATANASQLGIDAMGVYVEYMDLPPGKPFVKSQAIATAANW